MGRHERIPREVRSFVKSHIASITQLDVLMRLHADPQRTFTAEELSRELRIPERFLNAVLLDFTVSGVLEADEGPVYAWRFDPSGRHARVVDELATCLRKRKRSVHDLILSGLDRDVEVFSEAFRLRRGR
jgi:hypothetical protein